METIQNYAKNEVRQQRLPIDGGFCCPNRDGSKGWGGCTFCHPAAFAPAYCRENLSITGQLEAGKKFFAAKHRGEVEYLAYFQSYSGTYGSVETLRQRYEEALAVEGVTGLVIGTRPDCIDTPILDLLSEVHRRHSVMVEYGVESCYDETLRRIHRGHDWACAERAIRLTAERGIPVGVHLIVGLPGETPEMILREAEVLSALPVTSLKLHQLQIMRGTAMATEWQQHPEDFYLSSLESYVALVASFLQRLHPDIHVERFAASAPSELLLAPRWGVKPYVVQQMIEMKREKLCEESLTV